MIETMKICFIGECIEKGIPEEFLRNNYAFFIRGSSTMENPQPQYFQFGIKCLKMSKNYFIPNHVAYPMKSKMRLTMSQSNKVSSNICRKLIVQPGSDE